MGLHAEGEGGVGALEGEEAESEGRLRGGGEGARKRRCYLGGAAEVVVVNLLNGLEVDHPLQLGLMFV